MRITRSTWFLLGVLLIAAGASTRAPGAPLTTDGAIPTDQEPITPIPPPPPANPLKVALGARLFDDRQMSHDGTLACSSCHDIRANGTSKQRPASTGHQARVSFVPTTVFNAALNFRLNWEGNVRTLEQQAEDALNDPNGMAKGIDAAVRTLAGDRTVKRQFQEAYGHGPDRNNVLGAIATYERSLVTPNSSFDRWLGGDTNALSEEALSGYQLFKSFGCVSCHQGVNVGGNLFERSGVFHNLTRDQPQMLRVASLRNVAVMAPYFHDGSVATLDKAVRQMAYAQLDRALSDEQAKAIVAFLDTLTGYYQGQKLTSLP